MFDDRNNNNNNNNRYIDDDEDYDDEDELDENEFDENDENEVDDFPATGARFDTHHLIQVKNNWSKKLFDKTFNWKNFSITEKKWVASWQKPSFLVW